MKSNQENFIEFLDDEENIKENLNNLKIIFEDMKIQDNKHDLRLLLHFISILCNKYCHSPTFFSKIKPTLQLFKDEIKKFLFKLQNIQYF